MKFRRLFVRMLVCLMAGLWTGTVPGQTMDSPPGDTLTLKQCIDIAMKTKSDIGIAKSQLEIAGAQEKSALGNLFPSLSMSARGSHTEQGEGKRFFSGVEFTAPASSRDYFSAGFSLEQPLFTGGRLYHGMNMAEKGSQQAAVDYQSTRERITQEVASAYLDVLRARELIRVYEKTLESSQAQVDLVQERYNLGAVAKSDLYKARTRAGNDRINLLQQKQVYDTRKRNLNLVMGRNPAVNFALPVFEYTTPVIPDKDRAKQEALQSNKDLRSLGLVVDQSEIRLSLAKGSLLPTLGAFFSYDRTGFRFKELYTPMDKNWNYSYGISLSVPIFRNLNNRTNVQVRKAELSISERRYRDAKLQLEMQVENLVQQLETYREVIELNELNLESAEEDLRLAKERYNIGEATILDVLDAQAAVTNAQRLLVYVKFDARNTEIQLQRLLGNLVQAGEVQL